MASTSEQKFQKMLKGKNLKFTRERKLIFESVKVLKHHFDAEELARLLKSDRVSRDTVYRTIPLLLECGAIQKSVGKGKGDYFECVPMRGHHDHMVCVACGSVIEFHVQAIERAQEAACKEYGFELLFHDHRLFGYCKNCR